MPSEADALKEKSALFHKSKTNSADNNKTARNRTSPPLRKVLPDPQSATYKDWRFLLHIPMGLVDHPMGVAKEARLISVHTRTHIQNNILIFEAGELETYVSPHN